MNLLLKFSFNRFEIIQSFLLQISITACALFDG